PDERWPSCTELVRALKLSGMQETPLTTPLSPVSTPADSAQATRMALGGSGRLGTDPLQQQAPPLVKPSGGSAQIPLPPMPQLVTVGNSSARLATQTVANAATNPAVTLQRPVIFQTARMGSLGIAPPEKSQDGTLFPALVVALGATGRVVVERLKRVIRDRFGSAEKVPNVRFLYIDTDPETANLLGGTPDVPTQFAPREVVYAKLHRPAHYMTRDALPPPDGWMPSGSLYKLARGGGSAGGVRAFGRLALLDNYRLVAQRLRQEIETFLTDDTIMQADKATGLGMRTNRPRAYVVAGLAGGTGGGMFLDLAYLIRHELRQVGYMRPEVVGMFFVPPAEPNSPRNAALGNAFASLAELHHFDGKNAKYSAVFDKTEAAIHDPEPAFARTMILEYPKSQKPAEHRLATGLAARALFQEILTPAGRVVDEVRDVYRKAFPADVPTCQSFGLFRLSWPRPEMLTAATRRFAQRILQRWTAKEAAHLREPIAGWLNQQWHERRLGIEDTTATFHRACRDVLREDPDRVFDAFIDPMRTRSPAGGKLDASSACEVLDQLLKVVGKPDCENDPQLGSLHATLSAKFDELAKDAETHLASMAVSFIEQPQYRLAGAEEAVRQIGDRLKRQIDVLEPKRQELDQTVRSTYARLFQAIGNLGTGSGLTVRKSGTTAEVLDLLRVYPRKRLHLHVMDMCLSLYRKLHGNAPEFLREINYCRSALVEMHAALKTDSPPPAGTGPGKLILPDGCNNLDEAADVFLAHLSPEELMSFDQGVQKEAARKFRGLVTVCLKAVKVGAAFRELLLAKANEFLNGKLEHADPAAVFFHDRSETAAQGLIREAFDEAQPHLKPKKGTRPDELVTLAVPPGEWGERLRELASEQLPGIDLTAAPLPDDIAFYREYPNLPLADMPQLGDHAQEAYQQMAAAEHPPHARIDVPWTLPQPV
ncbi:MAG TPA: tubulin-like doman-containing protein, partial [Gemmataceae bacterium]|nr:tubulin-like doman-containing protein [Gemmataceae bacterium]